MKWKKPYLDELLPDYYICSSADKSLTSYVLCAQSKQISSACFARLIELDHYVLANFHAGI